MLYGIYEAEKRVERDGRLVCFAGEQMTMAEAHRRGLVDDKGKPIPGQAPEPAAAPAPEGEGDREAELLKMSRDELVALAAEIRAEHPKDANKKVIAAAIAAAEAAMEGE